MGHQTMRDDGKRMWWQWSPWLLLALRESPSHGRGHRWSLLNSLSWGDRAEGPEGESSLNADKGRERCPGEMPWGTAESLCSRVLIGSGTWETSWKEPPNIRGNSIQLQGWTWHPCLLARLEQLPIHSHWRGGGAQKALPHLWGMISPCLKICLFLPSEP